MHEQPSHADLVIDLLNIGESVPLTVRDMAASLEVTFFPPHERSPRLDQFAATLRQTLEATGATVIPFEEALNDAGDRIRPGIVIIEQGEGEEGEFAIHRISGLYQNPLVAFYDGPPPFDKDADLQETLDAVVGVLAWNQTQVPIFVEDDRWTICTMNGAVIECDDPRDMYDDVLQSLVPKLTAQVVPPKQADITYREGALDAEAEGYLPLIDDFMEAAHIWRANGLMLAHTSLNALKYRNRFYRRLVAAFLDKRTGMSYGFMARQLPTAVSPALSGEAALEALPELIFNGQPVASHGDVNYARVTCAGSNWVVPIPDVWILGTRSGCEKTRIDPKRDIVRLGLVNGRIVFDTPRGMTADDCRPSYDTMAILAHGVGNAIAASILAAVDPNSSFPAVLSERGLSLCHWHGYVSRDDLPTGYVLHGEANPPVSCSTPQSAVYALSGKLKALDQALADGVPYAGDIHVEPHHGTNMTGCLSLTESAQWVDREVARVAA